MNNHALRLPHRCDIQVYDLLGLQQTSKFTGSCWVPFPSPKSMNGSIEGADWELYNVEPCWDATGSDKSSAAQRSDASNIVDLCKKSRYIDSLLNCSEDLPGILAGLAAVDGNHSEPAPVPPSLNSSPGSNPSSSNGV